MLRREGYLTPAASRTLLQDPASLDAESLRRLAAEAFGRAGALQCEISVLEPEQAPGPLLPQEAEGGFVLDLVPAGWRSAWGGLLLFQQDDGRLHGYRPQPGALTLFLARSQPLISFVVAGAPARTAVLGWWR